MAFLELPKPGGGHTSVSALLAPGVFDGLSALVAEQAGAGACYLSGASVSYTQLGRSDVGFADLTLVADVAARIADRVSIPIIVDADTGFGNAINVERTVRVLERAGAAAIQIEDQRMPKRCGHLAGKSVIPADEMVGKIAAALDARRDGRTLIIARTDALAVEGVAAAFDRAARYLEAGADALFIEALRTEDELRSAADAFAARIPLVANMVEGGRTPIKPAEELGAMGYSLVIAPGALARVYAFAATDFLATLLRDGSSRAYSDRMFDFDQLNALIGTPDLLERAMRYDGERKEAAE
ncbi:MAG: carboxyvinyl-carboxyphosphonate phosphorylmutase [Alphaproteobacteria bacterium]|nr:carboxyvinyl-carboxyphosphonate phosphorylmutase [Alphaproteobacteria bacterium]